MRELEFAMALVQSLTVVIATEGVTIENKKIANEQMEKILKSIVKSRVQDLTASASGIIA
jgi:flagellar biosynthesis/type III secretory pathway chaperone